MEKAGILNIFVHQKLKKYGRCNMLSDDKTFGGRGRLTDTTMFIKYNSRPTVVQLGQIKDIYLE